MTVIAASAFALVCVLLIGDVFTACPAGWEGHGHIGHCYKVKTDLVSYVEARLMCRTHHSSDLIAIETPEEQEWVRKQGEMRNLTVDEGFWLGGSDWEVEGQWVWQSKNDTPIQTSYWGLTQPNNRGGSEDCLTAVAYFDFKWSDEFCGAFKAGYICEMSNDMNGGSPIVG